MPAVSQFIVDGGGIGLKIMVQFRVGSELKMLKLKN